MISSRRFMRVAGLCGVLGPIIAATCIGLAIACSPWFSWTGNFLSDLGGLDGERPIWAARGTASILLNTSIIIAGILAIVFASGLRRSPMLSTRPGRFGTLILIVGACAFTLIGIFPETIDIPHIIAAIVFFLCIPLVLFSIGATTVRSANKILGWFMLLLGVVAFGGLVLFLLALFSSFPWEGGAIPEVIASLPNAVFAIIFGIRLFSNSNRHCEPFASCHSERSEESHHA